MHRLLLSAMVACLISTTPSPSAEAAQVVDQSWETCCSDLGPISEPAGQSFTVGIDGQLTEIWIVDAISAPERTGTIKILFGDGLDLPLLAGPIPFVTTNGPSFGFPVGWKVIDVTSMNLFVVEGQQLSFVVDFTSTANWYVSCSGGYTGGRYLDLGHASCSPIASPPGTGDLVFRTYVDATATPVEASTWGGVKVLYK